MVICDIFILFVSLVILIMFFLVIILRMIWRRFTGINFCFFFCFVDILRYLFAKRARRN